MHSIQRWLALFPDREPEDLDIEVIVSSFPLSREKTRISHPVPKNIKAVMGKTNGCYGERRNKS
jgi:hypothetical protein